MGGGGWLFAGGWSIILCDLDRFVCASLDPHPSTPPPTPVDPPPPPSHENPAVANLYKAWLGKPNSHLAHGLLHTHYVAGGVEEKEAK